MHKKGHNEWTHEQKSKELVRRVLEDCLPRFAADGLIFTEEDMDFVEDLIDPDKEKLREAHKDNDIA